MKSVVFPVIEVMNSDISDEAQMYSWPIVLRGQAGNRGLDGEETHRVLEVWQRLQAL